MLLAFVLMLFYVTSNRRLKSNMVN